MIHSGEIKIFKIVPRLIYFASQYPRNPSCWQKVSSGDTFFFGGGELHFAAPALRLVSGSIFG